MRIFPVVILAVLITVSILNVIQAEVEVDQVQVLFRHGDRTPLDKEVFPNDIHNASGYELLGYGQLTNVGKLREFKIGQLLKTRYQELIDSVKLPKDVWAVSTDTDRTKVSLQLVLSALFPPAESQMWNSELPWNPIPIHFVPMPLDIAMCSYSCPEYEEKISQIRQHPEVKAKIAAHENLLELLNNKTGKIYTGPETAYDVYNLFVSQKSMNLTLPEWCTDDVLRELGEVAILEYHIKSYTKRMRRLVGGPLVRTFIENMRLNETEESPRKIHLYAGHETTITAFVRSQGMIEPQLPQYGAAVILEKLRDEDGKIFVRFILWTGVTEEIITLRLPGCEEICPIEKYLQLTREVIPSDEEMDCHWRRLSHQQLRDIVLKQITYD